MTLMSQSLPSVLYVDVILAEIDFQSVAEIDKLNGLCIL